MASPVTDFDDIQGLVRSGYGKLPEACFILLRIADPAAARSWLADIRLTTIQDMLRQRLDEAVHVALTADGLRALGVAEDIVGRFSAEFCSGIAVDDSRSRRLGDVGTNAPSSWQWGAGKQLPHVLVMLYADTIARLQALQRAIEEKIRQCGVNPPHVLPAVNIDDTDRKEPFGFADGISQPQIDWEGERAPGTNADLRYGNLIAPGEFLLGYPNEYGLYTDRPLLDSAQDPERALPAAGDDNGHRDLGRNGTYLVFRQLQQHVQEFWRFVQAQTGADPLASVRLAEAMVGRRMTGEPLVTSSAGPIRGVGGTAEELELNQFTYEDDEDGLRCPLGAHIRRANPRNGDMPGGTKEGLGKLVRTFGFGNKTVRDDLIASSRFHRILRRGRPYGIPVAQGRRPSAATDGDLGLHFICLNANISRQFEFIQNAWIMSADFDGQRGESDPLLGNREPLADGCSTDGFTQPQPSGLRRHLTGLPRFVAVRGGGYFFLPGLRALRFLARA
jgi:Dyp-type peroxidase family